MEQIDKINIRPGVSILSVLKHLNYKTWFALAEFVDNAIDSYLKYEKELKAIEGNAFKLKIEIIINSNSIVIKDNAAGIHQLDYVRAFRAAEIPANSNGLSEFGMGMKSAACWFSGNWTVTSTALGENVKRIVNFDINKIVNDNLEELTVETVRAETNEHFTIVEILKLHEEKKPQGRTVGKIKEHISSIYRDFFRKGFLEIYFYTDKLEKLEYKELDILQAPYFKTPNAESIYWKLEIPENFEIKEGLKITKGFIALLDKMETGKSGLSLFRRGRVIVGSGDEGFYDSRISGQIGSPRYKRVFGEIHLEGFQVSHTKDGFQGDKDMEVFIDILQDVLSNPNFPLLTQAQGYKKNPTDKEFEKSAQVVVKETVETAKNHLPKPIKEIKDSKQECEETQQNLTPANKMQSSFETFEIKFNAVDWLIDVELSWDSSLINWIEVGDRFIKKYESDNHKLYKQVRRIGIRVALRHPFCENFAGTDKSRITPLLRLAVAIGLSEIIARESGINNASFFRNNINKLLTDALSK